MNIYFEPEGNDSKELLDKIMDFLDSLPPTAVKSFILPSLHESWWRKFHNEIKACEGLKKE